MRSIRQCDFGVSFLAAFANFFANFAVKSFLPQGRKETRKEREENLSKVSLE